jgi:hypothetical protein
MVNMAKLAWSFNIAPVSKTVDTDIKTAYSDGFLTFEPRSGNHKVVIQKEYESARVFFTRYED